MLTAGIKMNNKLMAFELFRYQLLPIDRYLQGNLLNGVSSIEELIDRKNEFFFASLSATEKFSDSRHETITKKLFQDKEFVLLKIVHNRSIHLETREFKDEIIFCSFYILTPYSL